MLLFALWIGIQLSPEPAGRPYQQPQLAVSESMVAAAFGSGGSVYFLNVTSGGGVKPVPVKVAEAPRLMLGRHRGPRIAITPSAIVISAITGGAGAPGTEGDLMAWRSTDGGKTWSAGVRVNDVPNAAREGLHAMAAGENGQLFAAWLDLREKGMRLYGAVSRDGGATWSANRLIYQSPDGHICECCHPSIAIGAGGTLYAMWRNWLGGSRDLYLAASRDGGRSFQAAKLGRGTWLLNACPMDGGGLVVGPDGVVNTVWRRESSIFLAPADGAEQEVGRGKDAAIARGADGVYTVWTAPDGLRARVPGKPDSFVLAPGGAYASLAGTRTVYAAWEEKGAIRVERLSR